MNRLKQIMTFLKCLLNAGQNEQDIWQWAKDDGRS